MLIKHAELIAGNVEDYKKFDLNETTLNLIKELPNLVKSLLEGPRAIAPKKEKNYVPESKPGVLTLGSIYACFKMNDTDYYVAEAVLIFSHTIGVSRTEMICDLLRVGPLIQLKDSDPGRLAMADIFMFLRIPSILDVMVNKMNVSRDKLFDGLKLFVNNKSLLNEIDIINKCNYIEHLCSELVERDLITDDMADEIVKKRRAIIEKNDELGELLESTEMTQHSKVKSIRGAEQIVGILETLVNDENKLLAVIDRMLLKTDGSTERIFAVMCSNGSLDGFVKAMIRINKKCEVPGSEVSLRGSRLYAFDVSFMILVKLKYMFNDLVSCFVFYI